MSLQHFGKGALRVTKNYTRGYSDVQVKVRDATSSDPWGPSGTQMNELAQLTYNQQDFVEIMEMLDQRLNDKGKKWRHVFKSLTVLDYLLHAGSENVIVYFQDNIYVIKTLKEFQYIDEYGKDQGANVRQKAKDIANLLMDESRLKEQRRSRARLRDRMLDEDPVETGDDFENESARRRSENSQARAQNQEQEDLEKALALSRQSLADETRRAAYVAQQQETARLQALWVQDQQQQQAPFIQQQQAQWAASQQQQQANLFTQSSLPARPSSYDSTNPFALTQLAVSQQQQQANLFAQPSLQAPPSSYGSTNPFALAAPTTANTLANARRPNANSGEAHLLLDDSFADRDDGRDTFGNVGMLRYGQAASEEEERRLKAIEGSNSRALFDDGTPPAGLSSQRNNPFTLVNTSLQNAQQTRLHPQDSAITGNPFFEETQRPRELAAEAEFPQEGPGRHFMG